METIKNNAHTFHSLFRVRNDQVDDIYLFVLYWGLVTPKGNFFASMSVFFCKFFYSYLSVRACSFNFFGSFFNLLA